MNTDTCPDCNSKGHFFTPETVRYECDTVLCTNPAVAYHNRSDLCHALEAKNKAEEELRGLQVKYTAFQIYTEGVIEENTKLRTLLDRALVLFPFTYLDRLEQRAIRKELSELEARG